MWNGGSISPMDRPKHPVLTSVKNGKRVESARRNLNSSHHWRQCSDRSGPLRCTAGRQQAHPCRKDTRFPFPNSAASPISPAVRRRIPAPASGDSTRSPVECPSGYSFRPKTNPEFRRVVPGTCGNRTRWRAKPPLGSKPRARSTGPHVGEATSSPNGVHAPRSCRPRDHRSDAPQAGLLQSSPRALPVAGPRSIPVPHRKLRGPATEYRCPEISASAACHRPRIRRTRQIGEYGFHGRK